MLILVYISAISIPFECVDILPRNRKFTNKAIKGLLYKLLQKAYSFWGMSFTANMTARTSTKNVCISWEIQKSRLFIYMCISAFDNTGLNEIINLNYDNTNTAANPAVDTS